MSVVFLCVGIGAVIFGAWSWKSGRISLVQRIGLFCVWVPVWFLFSGLMLYSNITSGKALTAALANGQCDVVEGMVQVLHEQPYSGHDAGDHIQIGGREFTYNYYSQMLGYHQTISHGGQLKNGTMARLHYLGDVILKVEIKQ